MALQTGAGPQARLDLSNLYRHPVFQSRSQLEAQAQLARAIISHDLAWGRGSVETALYRVEASHISMLVLSYGAEVEVRPEVFADFTLVQMPLRGAAQIESDGVQLRVSPGETAVLSPRRQVRVLWEPGCEQLILKVPHALLREMACASCSRGHCPPHVRARADDEPVRLDPAFKIDPAHLPHWNALVQQLINVNATQDGKALHPAWLAHFEQTAALFLLTHQAPPSCSPPLDEGAGAADHLARERMRRVEEFIRSRLCAPISLADLARVAGVSARSLNVICHRCHGVAPMVLLRNLRLDAARRKLLSAPHASVTDVALEYGFGHLGRFSAYYRERFGELPRETGGLRH